MSVTVSAGEGPIPVWVPESRMERLRQFYRIVLAPAKYKEVVKVENGTTLIGFQLEGEKEEPVFWLKPVPDGQAVSPTYIPVHMADTKTVTDIINEIYNVAIQNGAKEKHKPKFRHISDDNQCYYNATVIDLEGNELAFIDGTHYSLYKETEGRNL